MSFFSKFFGVSSSITDSVAEEGSSSSESESEFSEFSKIQQVYQDINLIQLIDNVETVFEQKLLERVGKVKKRKAIQNEAVIYEIIDGLFLDINQDKFKMLLYKDVIEMVDHLIDLEVQGFKKDLKLVTTFDVQAYSSLIHCHFLENVIVPVYLSSKSKLFIKQDSNLIEVNDDNLKLIEKVYKSKIKRGEKIMEDLKKLLFHINEKIKIIEQNMTNFCQLEVKLLCDLYSKKRKRQRWINRLIK